jgi:hypothetical protein
VQNGPFWDRYTAKLFGILSQQPPEEKTKLTRIPIRGTMTMKARKRKNVVFYLVPLEDFHIHFPN